MLSKDANEKLFGKFFERHYLGHFLSRISLPPLGRAAAIALVAYLSFLVIATISERSAVLGSFLHKWQLSCSITLFLGLWLGSLALKDVRPWLEHADLVLGLTNQDFKDLVRHTGKRLASNYSSLMAAPLIVGGMAIGFLIARDAPNDLFPYRGSLPAFVYVVFLELSVLMLHLLGATGFWLLYVFTKAAQEMSRLGSVDYHLVDEKSLRYLSDTILRLCSYLLVIIASCMPGVAFVVFHFRHIPYVLVLGTIFGMALPTIGLTLAFFGPVYHLHKMLAKAKNKQLLFLRDQIRDCEIILLEKGTQMSEPESAGVDANSRKLHELRDNYLEAQRRSVWPFNQSSILKLSGSSMLPVISFFAQRVVQHILS